jgi:hypothetical protein
VFRADVMGVQAKSSSAFNSGPNDIVATVNHKWHSTVMAAVHGYREFRVECKSRQVCVHALGERRNDDVRGQMGNSRGRFDNKVRPWSCPCAGGTRFERAYGTDAT